MIKIKRQVLGLMAAAGLALITAPVPMAQASEGGTLNVAHVTFTMDWSPLRGGGAHFRWNSLWNASPMYIDAEGELHPYVFTSWQANEDSTEWTFEIDPDAAFSDGSPITAADVKGSWELSARPGTRNQRIPQVLSGVEGYAEVSGGDASELTGVTAGDGTVTVRLTDPDPIFFQKVANQIAPIVKVGVARNEAGDEVEEWWHVDNGVVVSGPFIPTEMDLDAGRVVFEPNPNFFGPAPMLDRIVLRTVEDPVTATSLLQSGEMDAHTSLNTPTRIQDLGAEFASGPMIPKGHHFWFNSFREPMNDPLVREALVRAVDPAGLIAVTYPDGPNQLANQILNAVNGVDEDWPGYSFDPEAARAALADSSYGGPEGLPRIMMVGISSPAFSAGAQYIAEQWRQNLGISAVEMKPQIDSYAGPDQSSVQVFRDDVGTRVPDAVAYLMGAIHSSSGNAQRKLGGFADPEIDALLEEAAALPVDDPRRVELAQQAQRKFLEGYYFIPFFHEAMSRSAMPYVSGIDKNLDWQVIEPWNITVER